MGNFEDCNLNQITKTKVIELIKKHLSNEMIETYNSLSEEVKSKIFMETLETMNKLMNTKDNNLITKRLDDWLINPEILLLVNDLVVELGILQNDLIDEELKNITHDVSTFILALMEIHSYSRIDFNILSNIAIHSKLFELLNELPKGNINHILIERESVINQNHHYEVDLKLTIQKVFSMYKHKANLSKICYELKEYLRLRGDFLESL